MPFEPYSPPDRDPQPDPRDELLVSYRELIEEVIAVHRQLIAETEALWRAHVGLAVAGGALAGWWACWAWGAVR